MFSEAQQPLGQIYRIIECNPEQKRPFRRTRTGCITCKIRRVRCDERKPTCNRCVSTGRKCDGYGPKDKKSPGAGCREGPSNTDPLSTQLRVALPRKNAHELRSYRFFLEVTAPAIAGAFETDFWLTYIPRTCHLDSAIWHAVVSLGAVHEISINSRGNTPRNESAFALQQCNAAINDLVRPSAPCNPLEEKWRALTASVLFTYLCSYQGLYSESRIHLTAAKSLIQELQGMEGLSKGSTSFDAMKRIKADTAPSILKAASVPYDDLFSVVACIEVTAQLLHSSGATDGPELLSEADVYITWRTYSAPSIPSSSRICQHGKCDRSRATPSNLGYAGRAIKSLLNGLMALSQRDAGDVLRLVCQGEQSVLATLIRRQQPYIHAFRELSKAMDIFVVDTFTKCTCFGLHVTVSPSQKKAVEVLRMYHATCYPLFLDNPTDNLLSLDTYHPLLVAREDSVKHLVYQRRRGRILDRDGINSPSSTQNTFTPDPQEALAMHFNQALDIAETVLQNTTPQTRPDHSSKFIPILPTTTPLLIMAHTSGITTDLRKRVIDLLRRYPQQEVFLESAFAAALCELTLGLEASDRHGKLQIEGAVPETTLTNKVYGAGVTFTKARRARVAIQTWDDWLANKPGQEKLLTW